MNKLKLSIPGQMLLILKTHFSTAVLFMVLFLLTFSLSSGTGIGSIIFSIAGTLGYFLSIYSEAYSCVSADKSPASKLSVHPAKGFILPLILTLVTGIIILFYKLAWTYGSTGENVSEIWSVVVNVITLLWFSPYQAFLGISHGHINLIGYLIIFILPYIASGLGYFAGCKGFDLGEKIRSIAYEKKDKDEI